MKINEYFSNSMNDIDSMYMGMYFRTCRLLWKRRHRGERYIRAFVYCNETAKQKAIPIDLIRCIYELRTLVINGEYPNVFNCGKCGNTENLDCFDLEHNSVICSNCHGKIRKNKILNPSTVYALQYIVTVKINKLFSFNVKEEVLAQLKQVIESYINKIIHKNLIL